MLRAALSFNSMKHALPGMYVLGGNNVRPEPQTAGRNSFTTSSAGASPGHASAASSRIPSPASPLAADAAGRRGHQREISVLRLIGARPSLSTVAAAADAAGGSHASEQSGLQPCSQAASRALHSSSERSAVPLAPETPRPRLQAILWQKPVLRAAIGTQAVARLQREASAVLQFHRPHRPPPPLPLRRRRHGTPLSMPPSKKPDTLVGKEVLAPRGLWPDFPLPKGQTGWRGEGAGAGPRLPCCCIARLPACGSASLVPQARNDSSGTPTCSAGTVGKKKDAKSVSVPCLANAGQRSDAKLRPLPRCRASIPARL